MVHLILMSSIISIKCLANFLKFYFSIKLFPNTIYNVYCNKESEKLLTEPERMRSTLIKQNLTYRLTSVTTTNYRGRMIIPPR